MPHSFLNPSPSVSAAGTAEKRMWHGVYTASVVSTQDPLRKSRVTLKVPQILGTSTSNWAVPVGFEPVIPSVNQVVWAMFLGGDINHPLYIYASTTNTSNVPGVPPVTNIQNATITNPVISGATLSSSTLNSPTINTPSISTPTVINGTFTSPSISGATLTGASLSAPVITSPAVTGGTYSAPSETGGTYANPVVTNLTGTGTLAAVVGGSAATWQSMILQNGWSVGSGGIARYKLNPDNTVTAHCANLVPGILSNATAFWFIPSGYIPPSAATQNFPVYWTVGTGSTPAFKDNPMVYTLSNGLYINDFPSNIVSMSFVIRYVLD